MKKNINPYEILKELCAKKKFSSAHNPQVNPVSERIAYIADFFESRGIDFEFDFFKTLNTEDIKETGSQKKFVNLYAFPAKIDKALNTLLFLAHHDVINERSQNVLDNTASLANLLSLAALLKEKPAPFNVAIAFTDAEETVSLTSSGAKRLADKIKAGYFGNVLCALNLELTARGRHLVSDCHNEADYPVVVMPYNDSVVLRHNGIQSLCLTLLSDQELSIKTGLVWHYCHSDCDGIELADENDMQRCVEELFALTAQGA